MYTHTSKNLCALNTISVKITFNSASWQLILEKLRRINESIINIIMSFVSQREILLEIKGICKEVELKVLPTMLH